ncbi:hypothetical protein DXF96_07605 [Heyndrickxia coagulans]|nr:hypothetical protein BIZ35_16105 [Heyndrickxia coagulans]AVD54988.1 hypothetical protein C3766_01890 [Heyndrickxia coagulans]AWP35863.1 hypothetical protein CYJ15_02040 [Heyndrickxia coagulans]KYC91334.1 hypothetical protein B4096_0971 [Heyndrickxia coagulans]QDI61361.1 hypothetical protein DXF96_07605 [Heyndrickxia coagulans]
MYYTKKQADVKVFLKKTQIMAVPLLYVPAEKQQSWFKRDEIAQAFQNCHPAYVKIPLKRF